MCVLLVDSTKQIHKMPTFLRNAKRFVAQAWYKNKKYKCEYLKSINILFTESLLNTRLSHIRCFNYRSDNSARCICKLFGFVVFFVLYCFYHKWRIKRDHAPMSVVIKPIQSLMSVVLLPVFCDKDVLLY